MTDRLEKFFAPGAGRMLAGCAGWTLTRDTLASFPEPGSHLERYASLFGAVEINSSFYRSHQAKTWQRWAECVPDDFRFSVKMPRTITHDAQLAGIATQLRQFADEIDALGAKLECVLVQLPPKLAFDAALAADFIGQVTERLRCMIALEARNESWFGEEEAALLTCCEVTRVIADPAKGQLGPHVPTTSNIYVRLHGAPRIYYSSYDPAYLAQLAHDMRVHALAGRTVWTMFDNTASEAAVANAIAVVENAPARLPAGARAA